MSSVFSFAQNTVYYWFDGDQNHNTLDGTEISTEGLKTGVHFVHFQIMGDDGLLGPVKSKSFLVINEVTAHSSSYAGINYWFDHQKAMNAYSGGLIDCSELAAGIHAVHFQIIDAENKVCPVQTQMFLQLQSEAYNIRYWFDDDAEQYMEPTSVTEINVGGLTCGHHTLHVQLADSNGGIIIAEPVSADFTIVCDDNDHVDIDNNGVCDVCDEPLTYTRATTADRYGTVCLPKGAEAGDITGATFYSIAGKRVNANDEPTAIVLEEVQDIEAGVPYIFLASESTLHVTYSGQATDAAGSYNGLVGSFAGQDVEEGMYLLSNNQIVKCGTGCTIGANRAYIDMNEVPEYSEGSVAPSRMRVIGLEGATGIDGLIIEGDAVRCYNLSGIRIPRGTKGITIINGRTIINK